LLIPSHADAISSRTFIRPSGETTLNYYGSSVAGAGDVNGDGYADVIVGAWGADSYRGRAYLYYGGPHCDEVADVVFTGEAFSDYFGSVAGIGDVNRDGFADVIVGGSGYNSSRGRAYVFYGSPSLTSMSAASADVILTGEASGGNFGTSVAGAGDVNGDGYPDVIVGASGMLSGAGRAYVFYGGPTFVSKGAASADVILTGGAPGDGFGAAVAGAGDVSTDGYDDLVVGAPYSYSLHGAAYTYYGGPLLTSGASANTYYPGADYPPYVSDFGVGSAVSSGDLNGDGYSDIVVGNPGFVDSYNGYNGQVLVILGGSSGYGGIVPFHCVSSSSNNFGASVSGTSDVNGDGFADLVVGAYGYWSGGIAWSGRVFVFFGGPSLAPKTELQADLIFSGETAYEYFGVSVAQPGDVDGDGSGDLLIGANGFNSSTGRALIKAVYPYRIVSPNGGEQWIAGEPVTVRWRGHDPADLAFSVDGGYSWSDLARGVGGADENEFTIVAPSYITNTARVRATYTGQIAKRATSDASDAVFRVATRWRPPAAASRLRLAPTGLSSDDQFGHSAAAAGDVNGDGYPDLIVGAPNLAAGTSPGHAYVFYGGTTADATPDVVLTGQATGDLFGFAVGTAGDVNGDGYADVIVGAPLNDTEASDAGRAYVYFGGPSMDAAADWALVTGAVFPQVNFGTSVATAGDVNRDGYSDVVIGAPAPGTGMSGLALVFHGGPSPDTISDLSVWGEGSDDSFGCSVASAGDVNGDGYSDIVVGAKGNDAAGLNAGRSYLYYGGRTPDNGADIIFGGSAAGDLLGSAVAGAGDVNGDGFPDLVVGAPSSDVGGTDAGRVFVYFGGPAMDGQADLIPAGAAGGDYFGVSVDGAGDVNSDGYADLIVGAGFNDAAGADAGRAYVFYGGPGADRLPDVTLSGASAGDDFGYSAHGAGDVNGDGFDDVIVGAIFNDAAASDAGRAYLYDFKRYFLLSPNGGETWPVGATRNVSWNGAEPADLWFTVDGGRSYELLQRGVGGSESNTYQARVPHAPTKFARVYVTPSNPLVRGQDESDSLFTIQTSVSLLALLAAPAPDRAPGALVTWRTDPGPEDLAGYRLERSSGSGEWATVAPLTRETSYTDPSAGPASRYRLFAVNGLGEELMLGETSFRPAAALQAWPLPYRGGNLSITFATHGGAGGGAAPATVALYDVTGRLVRTIARGEYGVGYQAVGWDGRDERGRPVAAGVYFLRTTSAGESRVLKVVIAR
jgi:hypothetical protein